MKIYDLFRKYWLEEHRKHLRVRKWKFRTFTHLVISGLLIWAVIQHGLTPFLTGLIALTGFAIGNTMQDIIFWCLDVRECKNFHSGFSTSKIYKAVKREPVSVIFYPVSCMMVYVLAFAIGTKGYFAHLGMPVPSTGSEGAHLLILILVGAYAVICGKHDTLHDMEVNRSADVNAVVRAVREHPYPISCVGVFLYHDGKNLITPFSGDETQQKLYEEVLYEEITRKRWNTEKRTVIICDANWYMNAPLRLLQDVQLCIAEGPSDKLADLIEEKYIKEFTTDGVLDEEAMTYALNRVDYGLLAVTTMADAIGHSLYRSDYIRKFDSTYVAPEQDTWVGDDECRNIWIMGDPEFCKKALPYVDRSLYLILSEELPEILEEGDTRFLTTKRIYKKTEDGPYYILRRKMMDDYK